MCAQRHRTSQTTKKNPTSQDDVELRSAIASRMGHDDNRVMIHDPKAVIVRRRTVYCFKLVSVVSKEKTRVLSYLCADGPVA